MRIPSCLCLTGGTDSAWLVELCDGREEHAQAIARREQGARRDGRGDQHRVAALEPDRLEGGSFRNDLAATANHNQRAARGVADLIGTERDRVARPRAQLIHGEELGCHKTGLRLPGFQPLDSHAAQ